MSDWHPGITRACNHWQNAETLQATYQAFESSFNSGNDSVIDCSKSIVECICQTIIEDFPPEDRIKYPSATNPKLGDWLTCAVSTLKLPEIRDKKFQKMISCHHKLATALNDMRNETGIVSHGKEGFSDLLSAHHQRAMVLSADAIVTYLFEAFQEAAYNLKTTREPYERFQSFNTLIDEHIGVSAEADDENGALNLSFNLPGQHENFTLSYCASELLYKLDREAYITAKNATYYTVDEEDTVTLTDSITEELIQSC